MTSRKVFGELALEKLWTCGKRDYVMMIQKKINLHSKDSVRGSKRINFEEKKRKKKNKMHKLILD